MAAVQIPGWTGRDGPASRDWNTCILGAAIIPGIVSVKQLKCGIECDTKKAKGSDQPTSRDIGLDPAEFMIETQLNEDEWQEFQLVFPEFNPRRPGRDRQPLQVIQPMVNFVGVHNVRVINVEMNQPTARRGLVVEIRVQEWFDKPKEKPKKKETPKPAIAARPPDVNVVGSGLVPDARFGTIEEIDPTVTENLGPTLIFGDEVYQGP